MTVKSTSIYLAFIAGATVICGALFEGMQRFLIVGGEELLSITTNPRAGIVYAVMGVIFGSLMWSITTTPAPPKAKNEFLRRYGALMVWAVLTGAFIFLFRDDPGFGTFGFFGFCAVVPVIIVAAAWSFMSQREERAKHTVRAQERVKLAERLRDAIEHLLNKDESLQHMLVVPWSVANSVVKQQGWWSSNFRDHANGSLNAMWRSMEFMKSRAVAVDLDLLETVRSAAVHISQDGLDVPSTDLAVANVEKLADVR